MDVQMKQETVVKTTSLVSKNYTYYLLSVHVCTMTLIHVAIAEPYFDI